MRLRLRRARSIAASPAAPLAPGRATSGSGERRQPAVLPQRLEVVQTLALERAQDYDAFDHLGGAQALGGLLRRKVPLGRFQRVTLAAQVQ